MLFTPPAPTNCLDSALVRHLERDGLAWGIDLDCGCATPVRRPGWLSRLLGDRT